MLKDDGHGSPGGEVEKRSKKPDAYSERLHRAAVAAGLPGYVDPRTGLYVFTELGLKAQEACCGSGCMHCPYDDEEQARAGRPKDP
jgi:ATP-binding cassette subfamily B (MDR/TAP) protein 1